MKQLQRAIKEDDVFKVLFEIFDEEGMEKMIKRDHASLSRSRHY